MTLALTAREWRIQALIGFVGNRTWDGCFKILRKSSTSNVIPVKTIVAPTKSVIKSPFNQSRAEGFTRATMTAVKTHNGNRLVSKFDNFVNLA